MSKKKVSIFWFRRDLRVDDNVGLLAALKEECNVLPIFIFDTDILSKLPKNDARVTFIFDLVQQLRAKLEKENGTSLAIFKGKPITIFKDLLHTYDIKTVFTNRDYEPYAKERDGEIEQFLHEQGIVFKTFKDQVIFEKSDILKQDGTPYVVYTPYKNKWKENFSPDKHLTDHDATHYFHNLIKNTKLPNLTLKSLGFVKSNISVQDYVVTPSLIDNYENTRNYPAIKDGTSKLGPHLRFGTVSIRKIIKKAISEDNQTFLSELIWREFFMQILWHFPHTKNESFKPKYDRIEWRNNEDEFEKWKNGQTGYALVDAGMRELNATGYMHNRVRMLTASFLCKHLLIDWRWGETYFAEKLLDYEMSSNVGNWQWAAGSGVDAAPYFRIFNPMTQVDKFDKQKEYINKWVPELQELSYPNKMVDHKEARERCLNTYKSALNN
ncbi:deoxyribodipyrimidine photo-lyase [Maribacter sp. MMG018]|uniref:cryptochrome/photolyase family protein n=1 Tax=Maribacter sp. MMG018 TaxID=2822688 RepID=UPI001B3740A4|nr:deoxyribodipyrimidine photo-lyase [Maribacter sp. MMG018]MBQ4915256.1 deoxyribodipyrimidine photo-lyase [Maribacter sp. MMG018]